MDFRCNVISLHKVFYNLADGHRASIGPRRYTTPSVSCTPDTIAKSL